MRGPSEHDGPDFFAIQGGRTTVVWEDTVVLQEVTALLYTARVSVLSEHGTTDAWSKDRRSV